MPGADLRGCLQGYVKPNIIIDTKALNAVFAEYASLSKRSIAENLNQKAYSICLSAYGGTKKATPAEIRKYLSGPSNKNPSAPVAAILINAKRAKNGEPGLRGGEMKSAVAAFIKKKSSHTNYLRVGWFQAIGTYAAKIKKSIGTGIARSNARLAKGGEHIKGGAQVAQPGTSPFTTFWNTAFSKVTTTNEGTVIAEKGLAYAIAKQMADMRTYIARKRQEEANRIFRKLGRF